MRWTPYMACVLMAIAMQAYAADSPIVAPGSPAAEQPQLPLPEEKADVPSLSIPLMERPIEEIIQSLTIEQRVGQLMLVTLQGIYGPNNGDRTMLRLFTPGGVVIPNIPQPKDAADYVTKLRTSNVEQQTGVPLLIGADMYQLTQPREGTRNTFVSLPSMLAIAAAADIPSTERLANLIAEHLCVTGFNMNVGPLLELAPTLPDAAGTLTNLGSDPVFAAQAGSTVVRALMAKGIIAMPAGFPGGGADRMRNGPATLLTPRPLLANRELLPFKTAVDAGAPIIHVANTLVPTLDKHSPPASLSSNVMRDVLRDELGFSGVVVAGPLDADDVGRLYPSGQAAVMALDAGADMLYWSDPGEQASKAYLTVLDAVHKGVISEQTLNAALARVLELKKAHALATRPLPVSKKAAALATKNRYPREAIDIERRSITLVQNRGNVLPLTKEASMPIVVTGVVGVVPLKDALEKHIKPVFERNIQTAKYLGRIEDFEVARLAEANARTTICVFTDAQEIPGQVKLVRQLKASGSKVVVVLLGYPANVSALREADAILLAYCRGDRLNESIAAIADALVGKSSIRITPTKEDLSVKAGHPETFDIINVVHCPAGRLPVTIEKPYEAGLSVGYAPSQVVKSVVWDFGDGTRSKESRVKHTYEQPGRYALLLTVKDIDNVVSTARFSIVVE